MTTPAARRAGTLTRAAPTLNLIVKALRGAATHRDGGRSAGPRGANVTAKPKKKEPVLLNADEVAALRSKMTGRNVNASTIRGYPGRDKMPAQTEPGRWDRDEIVAWIKKAIQREEEAPSDELIAEHQQAITAAGRDSERQWATVAAARKDRVPWDRIAEALIGRYDRPVSRQAAWRKFRSVDKPAPSKASSDQSADGATDS